MSTMDVEALEVVEGDWTTDYSTNQAANAAGDYLAVGALLGAGFLVWRALVVSNMPEITEPSSATVTEALLKATKRFQPIWLKLSVPPLRRAYELGSHRQLDWEELTYLGEVYANELGSYIHESSATALLEGFNALINRKWSPQIAYRRALEGFGLTSSGMRSYITSMENLNTDYLPTAATDDPRVNSVLTKLLGQRSLSIGENEAYNVQQLGQSLGWMKAADQGLIDSASKRLWYTAKDEMVCDECKPMNQKEVGIFEEFDTPVGQRWAPSLHPNCRCWVELIGSTEGEVSKADWDSQKHPRGGNKRNSGRFSSTWGTKPVNLGDKRPRDEIDQMLDDAVESINNPLPRTLEAKTKSFTTLRSKTLEPKTLTPKTLAPASSQPQHLATPMTLSSPMNLSALRGMTLPAAITYYFRQRANVFPEVDTSAPAHEESTDKSLYAYKYQQSEFQVGNVVHADALAPTFVDHPLLAHQMADDHGNAIKSALTEAIAENSLLADKFVELLYNDIESRMHDWDDTELLSVLHIIFPEQSQIDIYTNRSELISHAATYLVDPYSRPNEVYEKDQDKAKMIFDSHIDLQAEFESSLEQMMVDLLEEYDPDTSAIAHDLIPELFPQGIDDSTSLTPMIPTVFVIEHPGQVKVLDHPQIDFGLGITSPPYVVEGDFRVDHVSYVESIATESFSFPNIQTVHLSPVGVQKSLDAFGVTHLMSMK